MDIKKKQLKIFKGQDLFQISIFYTKEIKIPVKIPLRINSKVQFKFTCLYSSPPLLKN